MTIARTMDATYLNGVANHPEVRPFLGGGPAVLDLQPVLSAPQNVALQALGPEPFGGWVFHMMMPGVYEAHTLFPPEGRGRRLFAASREALRWMFTETDALELVTKCPDDNPGARMLGGLLGFRERFRREGAWAPGVGVSYRVHSVDDWFIRDPECLAAGRAFHAQLKAAEQAAGVTLRDHPEDETHDRAAGATALMIHAGQVTKGVAFYNRWATFAGYPGIAMVGPNVIDMHEAVIEVRGGALRVLLWRP